MPTEGAYSATIQQKKLQVPNRKDPKMEKEYISWRRSLKYYETKADKSLEVLQRLEGELELDDTWVLGGPEYMRVAEIAKVQVFHNALDKLEGLVIARVFELQKLNQSKTGEYSYELSF